MRRGAETGLRTSGLLPDRATCGRPQLSSKEALLTEIEQFADCIETNARPITDGARGLRVRRDCSPPRRGRCAMRGQPVDLGSGADGVMIPFLDLRAQYQPSAPSSKPPCSRRCAAATTCWEPPVERFEEEFAAYCGVRHAVAVNSGTSALHLALLAAGVGPGDEVITVPMTFVATVAAILYTGATPVFVDVDPRTWTMDPALARGRDHAAHQGDPARAPARAAGRHGPRSRHRAASWPGGDRGRRAGAWRRARRRPGRRIGDLGCFSFYPGKNLGACGEGGAVTTNDPDLAAVLRSLRDWGQEGKYNHVRHGFNYRMDALQGAVLGVKLPHLDAWTPRAAGGAARISDDLPRGSGSARAPSARDHVYHVYAIRVPDATRSRERLHRAGVATASTIRSRSTCSRPTRPRATAGGRSRLRSVRPRYAVAADLFPELSQTDISRGDRGGRSRHVRTS